LGDRHRQLGDVKMDLKESGDENVALMYLAQKRDSGGLL
jgi:hypothetical protein